MSSPFWPGNCNVTLQDCAARFHPLRRHNMKMAAVYCMAAVAKRWEHVAGLGQNTLRLLWTV